MNDIAIANIASYANLYLSHQLEIDDWISDILIDQNLFCFYTKEGTLFANYLAQWLEYQKKRGAKSLYLSSEKYHEEQNETFQFIYRDEFTIVCQFEQKKEIWVCCYPKTLANDSRLNLKNNDIQNNYGNRSITYVLMATTADTSIQPTVNWNVLSVDFIAQLNQLWPIPASLNEQNKYVYFYEHFPQAKHASYLPVVPPDIKLIMIHELLQKLTELKNRYNNDTNLKNDSSFYYYLSSEEQKRFQHYGEQIKLFIKKVLQLAGSETRWQVSYDTLHAESCEPQKNIIINTDLANEPKQITIPATQKQTNSKKGCLILSILFLATIAGIGYALFHQFWPIILGLLLTYIIIKK